jgi:hypothetical protein
MAWVGTAVSAATALYGAYSSKRQGDAAKKALKAGDPFGPYRKHYGEMLKGLTADPTSFLSNPLYTAAFGQGQQAVMRGMGPGLIGSGNMGIGLQQYGMGFAWDALQAERQFLAQLAGAQIAPIQGPGLEALNNSIGNMQGALGQLGTIFGGFGGAIGGAVGGGGGGGGWGTIPGGRA